MPSASRIERDRGSRALRLLERNRRLRGHPAAEVPAAELEEVVGLAHAPAAPRTDRSEANPRKRAHSESSRRAVRRSARSSLVAARGVSAAPDAGGP